MTDTRRRWTENQRAARRITSSDTNVDDHIDALISHHSKGHGPSTWVGGLRR